MLTNNFGQDVA